MSLEKLVIDPAVRAEIEALTLEHSWLVDNNESQRIAELYTENGCLLGVGPDKVGRKALTDYGTERAGMRKRTARHVVSNLRLIRESDTRIKGSSTITLFRADGEERAPADPIAVADCLEKYEKCADSRWRIAERRIVLVFESEAHKAG